ncbi:MAG: transcriptional repressor [Chloroflexi bacterium]|nr:transcriptional repressor [Chloroflexota bacterium]
MNEVLALARSEAASLGIATVYRNLKALQLEGWIAQVDVPGQPPRWEVAPKDHHHHFLCEMCDRLLEIQDCPEGLVRLLPEGYTLHEHDILLRGQCDACSQKTLSGGLPRRVASA